MSAQAEVQLSRFSRACVASFVELFSDQLEAAGSQRSRALYCELQTRCVLVLPVSARRLEKPSRSPVCHLVACYDEPSAACF